MSIKSFLYVTTLLVLAACASDKKESVAPSQSSAPSTEKHVEAARLAIVLGEKIAGHNLPQCKLTSDEATNALAQLQSWRRDAIEHMGAAFNSTADKVGSQWKDCRKNCECGLYLDVLDGLEPSRIDKKAYDKIKQGAVQLSTSERRACAERFQSVCEGTVIQELGL